MYAVASVMLTGVRMSVMVAQEDYCMCEGRKAERVSLITSQLRIILVWRLRA